MAPKKTGRHEYNTRVKQSQVLANSPNQTENLGFCGTTYKDARTAITLYVVVIKGNTDAMHARIKATVRVKCRSGIQYAQVGGLYAFLMQHRKEHYKDEGSGFQCRS